MKLIIDGSNLRLGGGLVHLKNLLNSSVLDNNPFRKIIVYGGRNLLENLSHHGLLDLREIKKSESNLFYRLRWQQIELPSYIEKDKCLLFFPGGLYLGNYSPYVTMFQNMQVFQNSEKNREGFSKEWLRLHLLQIAQIQTFRNSAGLICLSNYALNQLQLYYSKILKKKKK